MTTAAPTSPPPTTTTTAAATTLKNGQQPRTLHNHSYLKGYPYLFVRETDQPDYFCTLCESDLKEEDLQEHLFQDHRAEAFENNFVRVSGANNRFVHVCVVCWAKIVSSEELINHRRTCKVDPPEEELQNGAVPMIMNGRNGENAENGGQVNPSKAASPESNGMTERMSSPGSSSEILVVDEQRGQVNPSKRRKKQTAPTQILTSGNSLVQHPPPQLAAQHHAALFAAATSGGAGFPSTAQCVQCVLCQMVVPTQGYAAHLRDYHRITCSLDDTVCPLCFTPVPLMELPLHMSTAHGMLPQVAVNAILLWVLTASTLSRDGKKMPPGSVPRYDLGGFAGLFPFGTPHPTTQSSPSKLNSLLTAPQSLKGLSGGSVQAATTTGGGLMNGFNPLAVAAAAAAASSAPGGANFPTVLQSLLNKDPSSLHGATTNGVHNASPSVTAIPPGSPSQQPLPASQNLAAVGNIVSKFTRCHYGENGKQSIQCLICSKWFAVPPVKHLRGHMVAFKDEKRRIVPLNGGGQICIICYDVFDNQESATEHLNTRHNINGTESEQQSAAVSPPSAMLQALNPQQAAAVAMFQPHFLGMPQQQQHLDVDNKAGSHDDIPTVIDFNEETTTKGGKSKAKSKTKKVELDNAGRVKSGKVRKQCELCGAWSNIKWFFKHMSEEHNALFCRCCREYLPTHEHEEHKKWHAQPPYMGQKIRIENGMPVIIDRKERASLTPIGSLASWGGSSGGKVVRAVDLPPSSTTSTPKATSKKRKATSGGATATPTASPFLNMSGDSGISGVSPPARITSDLNASGFLDFGKHQSPTMVGVSSNPPDKDTLMPKETCNICGIKITYKNLARHMRLKHKGKAENFQNALNEEEGNGYSSGGDIDPSEFLEQDSKAGVMDYAAEDEEDNDGGLVIAEEDDQNGGAVSSEKKEEFRANTSKNKLESLVGKAFKHPRRRCNICGYTVSYSNFKRHLRNAHPSEYADSRSTKDDDDVLNSLSQVVPATSVSAGNGGVGIVEEEMEEEEVVAGGKFAEDVEDEADSDWDEQSKKPRLPVTKDGFVKCPKCGDRIVADFYDQHQGRCNSN